MIEPINPSGLCQCGCGNTTPLSRATAIARGYIKGQHTRYCMGHKRSLFDDPSLFWRKVDILGEDECWEWTGYVNDSGYACIRTKGNKLTRASRIAYQLHYGQAIPDGMFACHRCDNPKCCNPRHIFPGTPADNHSDMYAKGRESHDTGLKGEANNGAKLTAFQVETIKSRYSNGGVFQRELAAEFGVSLKAINRIIKGHTWTHPA